jgi:hypothetical protein
MKYAIASIFALMLILPLYGQGAKFYCTAQEIELTDSAILVHLKDGIYEIDSVQVDQGGIFFSKNMLRCANCRRTLNPKNTCECPKNFKSA